MLEIQDIKGLKKFANFNFLNPFRIELLLPSIFLYNIRTASIVYRLINAALKRNSFDGPFSF